MSVWRAHEPKQPVRFEVDGVEVVGDAGEPVAMSIAASGRLLLSRSVKYHRPRGASCYSGRCEGCLMRVDGVPNVTTCTSGARDGMRIETQNVVGGAETDLLQVTDWFFPGGMDHHHLMTRPAVLNRAMQRIARRLAGVGTLPDEVRGAAAADMRRAAVVVVGGGASGGALWRALRTAGVEALLVEERPERARRGEESALCGSAVGVYGGAVLVRTEARLVVVEADALAFATGTHESTVPLAGGDLPGVVGADGARALLARRLVPGRRVLLVESRPGELAILAGALAEVGATVVGPLAAEAVCALEGGSAVERAEVRADGLAARWEDVDAVVLAGPRTGAIELPAQAGAGTRFEDGGFFVEASEADGRTAAAHVFAVGSVTGVADATAARQVEGAAKSIVACGTQKAVGLGA